MANSITPFIPLDTSDGSSIEIKSISSSVQFPGVTDMPGGQVLAIPISVPNNTLFAMARIPRQMQYTMTAINYSASHFVPVIYLQRDKVEGGLAFISYANSNGQLTLYQNTPVAAIFSPTSWSLIDEAGGGSGLSLSASSGSVIHCVFRSIINIPSYITRYDTSNCVIELLFATAIVE